MLTLGGGTSAAVAIVIDVVSGFWVSKSITWPLTCSDEGANGPPELVPPAAGSPPGSGDVEPPPVVCCEQPNDNMNPRTKTKVRMSPRYSTLRAVRRALRIRRLAGTPTM